MRYLSVCSGIEAATVAWKPLGWNPVAFSEIEAFPSAVLDYHYPNTPNLGDMERFHEWPESNVDVLVGGTPCQSFSVAGLRRGLDDPRGNLALIYLAIAECYRPDWLVWENVPGVLSANGGRAFGAFLGGLEKLGYGWAYRTLDAQYFGLAQRRRRVFVVASARGWGAAGSVLFEPESLRGDSAPSRESGERVADSLTVGANQYSGFTGEPVAHGLIPDIASTVTAGVPNGGAGHGARSGHAKDSTLIPTTAQCLNAGGMGRQDAESETLLPHAFDARQNEVCQYGDMTGPLDTDGHSQAVAFETGPGWWNEGQQTGTLRAEGENRPSRPSNVVREGLSVRRLTPRECERLQGFPDDYTLIPYRNGWAKDGPRYKALGNSMAVPVVRWIGERIQAVQEA